MILDTTVFYISIVVSLLASLLVVTRRNPIYSAVFMVLFFGMISIDFLILRAPFLAVIQVLVYAGAIMVLYLFVIMLLNLRPEELREEVTGGRKVMAFLASTGLFVLLAGAIRNSEKIQAFDRDPERSLVGPLPEALTAEQKQAGSVSAIAVELFEKHALAFELTSILILIAIIGAIYLTKKREVAKHGTRA